MPDIRILYNQLVDEIGSGKNVQNVLHKLIDIFPEAANSYDHDIADSIGMYICDRGDHTTISYLKTKIKNTTDDFLKHEFNEWIEHLQRGQETRGGQ